MGFGLVTNIASPKIKGFTCSTRSPAMAGQRRRSRRNTTCEEWEGGQVPGGSPRCGEVVGGDLHSEESPKAQQLLVGVARGSGLLRQKWWWSSTASKTPRKIQGGRKDKAKKMGQVGGAEYVEVHRETRRTAAGRWCSGEELKQPGGTNRTGMLGE